MLSLTQVLEQHRGQLRDEQPWVWLYEVELPTSPKTRVRVTNSVTPVQFGTTSAGVAVTFTPYPVAHDGFRETAAGDIPTLNVTVGNPTRELGALIEQYDGLVGAPAVIRLVSLADVGNVLSQIEERSEVRRARVAGDVCSFALSAFSLYRRKFPPWRFTAFSCRWLFGGVECGYVIPPAPGGSVGTGFATCGKTLGACDERGDDEVARGLARGHPERFGARPGLARTIGGA